LARFRDAERALLRPADFRPAEREDLRELLRAALRPPRLADLALRALLAPLRADFLLPRFAALRVDFLRAPPPVRVGPSERLAGVGSSKAKDDGEDAGEGEGGLSEGRGSIHPEPDQPISI
jgi:hypothetical protein